MIKLHALLDLRGAIPSFIYITESNTREVNILDGPILGPSAFYLLDRRYLDFERLFVIHQAQAFFVSRVKIGAKIKCRYSQSVDRESANVLCVQIGILTVYWVIRLR